MVLVGIGFVRTATKHSENYGITIERVPKLRNMKLLVGEHIRGTFIYSKNES
jgi:hypothetical protein